MTSEINYQRQLKFFQQFAQANIKETSKLLIPGKVVLTLIRRHPNGEDELIEA